MRYPSIDILRTIAISVMVIVHFGENLSGVNYGIAGLGAPLFTFLAGVSYRLWLRREEASGASDEKISKVTVRRGLFIFGVGIAFNVLVWLPEDVFNWDVLTFIGVSLLLLNGLRRLPLTITVWIAVLALLISPLLRGMAEYHSYWENMYYDYDWTLSDLLIGFLAVGYFPIFPWIAYPLTGFVAASLLFPDEDPDEPPPSPWPIVLSGSSLLALAISVWLVRPYLPKILAEQLLGGWTMFPPTLVYVTATLGTVLMLLGLGHQFVDRNPRAQRFTSLLRITKTFSRYSFTIYVLHHLIHVWPLWIYGMVMGQETTFYWRMAMPPSTSLALAFTFLVLCYAVLRWLGPERTYGIEAGMRWLCD
jgi:uncharacterized membrane protein